MKKLYGLYSPNDSLIALYKLTDSEAHLVENIFIQMTNEDAYFCWNFEIIENDGIYETKEK